MKKIFLLLSLLASSFSQARETDQFLVWNVELKDSSSLINTYLANHLEKVLAQKKLTEKSCQDVTLKFFHRLIGTFTFSQFSLWAQGHEEMREFRYPPHGVGKYQYVGESIFGGSGASPIIRFLIGLAPSINVNGVYFGTDKLGHISYMGNKYFKKYLKLVKKGMSKNGAIIKVLEDGIRSEEILGGFYGTSSPSDLEANYQGLRLAIDMCEGASPILEKVDGRWQADMNRLKIENYVTPEYDESYYPIIFGKRTWEKSARSRIKKFCLESDMNYVKSRFDYYRSSFTPSANIELIKSRMQKETKFNNNRFDIQTTCDLEF